MENKDSYSLSIVDIIPVLSLAGIALLPIFHASFVYEKYQNTDMAMPSYLKTTLLIQHICCVITTIVGAIRHPFINHKHVGRVLVLILLAIGVIFFFSKILTAPQYIYIGWGLLVLYFGQIVKILYSKTKIDDNIRNTSTGH